MQHPCQNSTAPASSFDVAIIGGGPAGSTAGAWLAQQGISALICEKECFPRFHIGESLLPNGNQVLQKIGVWEKIETAGFVEKYGAEFTVPDRSQSVHNVFADGLVKGMEKTYQVERSRFDKILLDHAAESGCEVRQQTIVRKTERTADGWTLHCKDLLTESEYIVQAKWIIDASGRHCSMGRALGIPKESIPYPGRFAVFNHFEGFPRSTGKDGGDIIVLRLEDAWFWAIPISKTVTSVGVVAQKGARAASKEDLEAFFQRKAGESSFLSQSLKNATATGPYRIESDYCFSYESYGADQVLLTGDAASFIDPVFSSGVYLALESGLLAAQTIEQRLKSGAPEIPPQLYEAYTRNMKEHIRVMRRLIESYYDNTSFEVFMFPHPRLAIPRAINSILAGCTRPPFSVKWRFWLFEKICALHKKRPIAPAIDWLRFRT